VSGPRLVAHQFRYDQKAFWRNPAAVFFTVAFPVILLLIFATVFGDQTIDVRGGIETTAYYVPAIITVAVISATMQSLAMTLVIAREDGRLKRGRGTPMPAWVFIAGRVGNSIVVALLMLALIAAIGRVLYGVAIPEVLGCAASDELAGGDDRHPVGEALRLVHVVGGEEDRLAEIAQTADHVPSLAPRRGIEARGRLVEEEQLGIADQRHADVEAALLATGEAARPGVCLLGESD